MQNAQNAAEIQQRVINLVELYRTKVGKESEIAHKAKEERDYWDSESEKLTIDLYQDGVEGPFGIDLSPEMPSEWVNALRVNEQLLGHFYSIVAGNDADKKVLDQLLPDLFDTTIFSIEEEAFLAAHFRELVNYIIQTPCNDLEYLHYSDSKDISLIPEEVLTLIKSRVNLPVGSVVYNPFAGFGQFVNCFRDSQFYCEESYSAFVQEWNDFCDKCYEVSKQLIDKEGVYEQWAWLKVALFANDPNAIIIEDSCEPSTYDAIMAFIPMLPKLLPESTYGSYDQFPTAPTLISKIRNGYKKLRDGGDMILIVPNKALWDAEVEKPFGSLWEELVDDHAIVEIIQLPSVMSKNLFDDCCIIIAKKGYDGQHTTMIDARFATAETSQEKCQILDLGSIAKMLENGGMDIATGLRKLAHVPSSELNADLLFPQVYVIEKPSQGDHPVPLSVLCSFESTMVREVKFDLPEDTPWITMSDITPLFTGDLDLSKIMRADCPNNPPFIEGSKEYAFSKSGKFIDSFWAQGGKTKGRHVLGYRQCTLLDGNSDAVLYERSLEHGVLVAIVRSTGKPYAVSKGILVFSLHNGIDAKTLAALLRLPIVYRQMIAYEQYGIGLHLDDILVPTDKRIIGDELYSMKREESVANELGDKVQAMKTEYINEVRMRKHDMGQKVFDLINTEDLMRYYVENRETESDLWCQIEEQLDHFRNTIRELSDMLDQLSQEEHFGTPELIDLNDYFAGLKHSSNINGFKLSYQIDKASIHNLQISHMRDKGLKDISAIQAKPTVLIAKSDLQRVVTNILTNAQKHGFLDSNRKDYEVSIRLEFNAEKGMYQIDFRNNGKPLPDGMNKMRYGIKGEKAGQTAGTGLGGSVVKSIVEHYKGDYDIFMDGEWTVIRVYLPIAI